MMRKGSNTLGQSFSLRRLRRKLIPHCEWAMLPSLSTAYDSYLVLKQRAYRWLSGLLRWVSYGIVYVYLQMGKRVPNVA
ncbi:hypothetical protein LY76DRAFT_259424 [Colletotrichum caudatum]|nr:hypothetical protein LY76DRAFT_259424 [Colletotrichum caudatum]